MQSLLVAFTQFGSYGSVPLHIIVPEEINLDLFEEIVKYAKSELGVLE